MSHSFNKKYFNIILSITRWITKVGVVAFFIFMGLLLLAAGVVMFLPIELFDFDLANLANLDFQYLNAFISVNPDLFSGIVNVKWLVVSGGLIALLNLGGLQFIFITLRNVIRDVSDGKPFSTKNIVRINRIGYAFVIVAIIFPIFNGLIMTEFLDVLSLNISGSNYMVNFQQLFIGFLIIVLANIFDYGSYLQEDHDMTV